MISTFNNSNNTYFIRTNGQLPCPRFYRRADLVACEAFDRAYPSDPCLSEKSMMPCPRVAMLCHAMDELQYDELMDNRGIDRGLLVLFNGQNMSKWCPDLDGLTCMGLVSSNGCCWTPATWGCHSSAASPFWGGACVRQMNCFKSGKMSQSTFEHIWNWYPAVKGFWPLNMVRSSLSAEFRWLLRAVVKWAWTVDCGCLKVCISQVWEGLWWGQPGWQHKDHKALVIRRRSWCFIDYYPYPSVGQWTSKCCKEEATAHIWVFP